MTGFGAAAGDERGAAVRVEIRSVNHRHLQVKTRLPSQLSHLESSLEGRVRKALGRGAVTLTLDVQQPPQARAARVSTELAGVYLKDLRALTQELGLPEPTLDQVLGLPGVVTGEGDEEVWLRLEKGVQRIAQLALASLVSMRAAEGSALERELRKHSASLVKVVDRIEKRMPKVVREHQAALQKRVSELAGDFAVSAADLARELALIADKGDVTEEISRLRSHIEQFDALLDKGGAVGRTLDFLIQEHLREINTVGSKCADAQVAHLVVDAKTRIERLREQVQNVE